MAAALTDESPAIALEHHDDLPHPHAHGNACSPSGRTEVRVDLHQPVLLGQELGIGRSVTQMQRHVLLLCYASHYGVFDFSP
jgi:hypothetical protein